MLTLVRTTPDPGHLANVFIDGTGRYSVGPSTLGNANGLITLEYINSSWSVLRYQ